MENYDIDLLRAAWDVRDTLKEVVVENEQDVELAEADLNLARLNHSTSFRAVLEQEDRVAVILRRMVVEIEVDGNMVPAIRVDSMDDAQLLVEIKHELRFGGVPDHALMSNEFPTDERDAIRVVLLSAFVTVQNEAGPPQNGTNTAQKAEREASDLKGSMRKRMEFLDLD